MIADDYDDYGDDYGDDYDDYGDYGAAGYAAARKKGSKQQPKQQPVVPKKKKNVVASQAAGGGVTTTKAAATAAASGGVGSSGITVLSAASSKQPATSATAAVVAPPTARPPPEFAGTAAAATATAKPSSASGSGPTLSGSSAASNQTSAAQPPPVPSELLLNQDGEDGDNRKQHLTLVVLGHVDAGKSTVTGHLLYGNSTSGTSRRGNKQPQNYAWLLDEDEKEREHGITMDIATKTLATRRYNVVLQDAPGHADYVPSAITGTANANAALLVVDSTDYRTSFESGQFKQHAFLARGLGVVQILVVINKMDLINWKEESYQQIQKAATNFLIQTVGYPSQAIRCVPASGITGANIHTRAATIATVDGEDEASVMSWYKGPTLVDAIDSFFAGGGGKGGGGGANARANLLNKHLRLVLTDVVGESGKANRTSARAKILQGWLKSGEQLTMLPLGDSTTVQKLSSLHATGDGGSDTNIMYAGAGEMIDIVLGGVDTSRVLVGNTLSRPNSKPPIANKCRARIWVMEGLVVPIIRGSHAIFHIHHLNMPCHITKLFHTINPKQQQQDAASGDSNSNILKKNPRALGASTQAVVEITLQNSCVIESFDDCRALGRFVLRRGGDSIAIGRIEQVIL